MDKGCDGSTGMSCASTSIALALCDAGKATRKAAAAMSPIAADRTHATQRRRKAERRKCRLTRVGSGRPGALGSSSSKSGTSHVCGGHARVRFGSPVGDGQTIRCRSGVPAALPDAIVRPWCAARTSSPSGLDPQPRLRRCAGRRRPRPLPHGRALAQLPSPQPRRASWRRSLAHRPGQVASGPRRPG